MKIKVSQLKKIIREEIHNVDDETDVINDRNEVEDNLSLIVYELNEKIDSACDELVETLLFPECADELKKYTDEQLQHFIMTALGNLSSNELIAKNIFDSIYYRINK